MWKKQPAKRQTAFVKVYVCLWGNCLRLTKDQRGDETDSDAGKGTSEAEEREIPDDLPCVGDKDSGDNLTCIVGDAACHADQNLSACFGSAQGEHHGQTQCGAGGAEDQTKDVSEEDT